jgi:hypothetical protein
MSNISVARSTARSLRRPALGAGAALLALAGAAAVAAPAHAEDVTVTATTTDLSGTRVLTVGPAVVLAAGDTTLNGTLEASVVETAKRGTTPWSVTAVATGLTSVGGATIAADNLSVAPATPVVVGGHPNATAGAGGQFGTDVTRTLFTVTGESTTTSYTGTYTSTGALALQVPNGTPTDAYTGTITVTLVQ